MSEFQSLVTPGQNTVLSPQLQAGATIFNKDPANAVWISANPNPGPGNGYKVGGYGSIQWQATGAAYASVDTGVVNPVSLTVSDHVGNPVNPVDVGNAVAEAVNARGIPNVLLGKLVYSGPFPAVGGPGPGAGSFDIPVDMSQYASVNITLAVGTATNIRVEWVDIPTGVVFTGIPYTISDVQPGYSTTVTITSTVRAATLRIWFTNIPRPVNPLTNSVWVFATNRVTAEGMTSYDTSYTATIPSQAWGAGQMVSFLNPTTSFNCKGGPATVRVTSSQAAGIFKGFLGYYFYDGQGVQQNCFVLTTGVSDTSPNGTPESLATLYLPPGVLGLFWQNSGTPNTYDVKLQITMGGV